MNNLAIIRSFAGQQTSQIVPASNESTKNGDPYLAALKALAQSSEWLQDQALVEQVVSRLETVEPQSSEARAQTAAIYRKLISPNSGHAPIVLNTTQIKISDQKAIDLPTTMLMAESAVLQRLLSKGSGQPIDLSGKASNESLSHLATHLSTGETDFVTDENALELLLLAKEFELSGLAMECLEPLLDPSNGGVYQSGSERQISDAEYNLRHLLQEARTCSITISMGVTGSAHVKMEDGSKEEQWECLMKLHDYIPVTHLELTTSKDLDRLLAFTKHNPDLVSLCLGKSADITDAYLEQLSQNLSKLHSFSIDAAPIQAIPQEICDQAVTVVCSRCDVLESISAPNAVAFTCRECNALTSISVPNAVRLICRECNALTIISAPNAITLACTRCDALISINAPNAATLICRECNALESISVPNAARLTCRECDALTSICAPNMVTLDCRSCKALTSISAPNVVTLDCRSCKALTSAVKLELFNVVRRNILLTKYRDLEKLIDHLSKHDSQKTMYGLDAAAEIPLKQWFIDAQQLSIPADFNSPAEKLECAEKINVFYERLISYAADQSHFQKVDLNWFKGLRKLDSQQQQMSRLIWLGSLLASTIPSENPLADQEALPTLKAIGNLGDPFLQEGATRALFSMYATETADRKDAWVSLKENRSDHLLLPCLFFARANISSDQVIKLLAGLNVGYYTDFKVLNPILEIAYQLSSDPTLTAVERENILQLVLIPPEKGPRQRDKKYAEMVKKYRAKQPMCVNACRDLLLFRRASELINDKDGDDLLNRHKRTCLAIFGVKKELLHSFVDTFKSQRYPNGLFTYAARLQTLPDNETGHLTELLGQFVNGVLERTFPESRYDLSNNKHLKTVFDGNETLLRIWKEPLEIDLQQTENLPPNPEISPCDIVKGLMAQAIGNHHLGEDQEKRYPTLVAALKSTQPELISTNIITLEERLKDMQDLFGSSVTEDKSHLKKELSYLEIELLCLLALDPRAGLAERKRSLNTLREKLPKGIEFRHDLQGVLDALEPSKSSKAKWVKIQTTEAWEDFLLMGTEVNNSCQRIDGDPHLNKCLLAYILDGKNQLMIVRDSNGKIAARSVLRILWDVTNKHPVLFMEQIYKANADPALEGLVIKGCEEKAKRMGLTLVTSPTNYPEGTPYMDPLSALGGPAPFEYVDALSKIQHNEIFTLPTSNIVYMPEIQPTAS